MAYQRRKRRFDRKKVVLVERTICILILLALLALAGRWIAGQLSKEDSQKKKQTKTQTDNTAQKEDKTEAENTQTPVYDFVCSDGTLSAEFQQTLSDRAKEDTKVQKILADSRNYPVSMLELLAKNAETTDFVADYLEKKDEAPAESIGEVKEGEIPLLIQWDERWGYIHYGDGIIANSGCGPTALAMVAAGLTGDNSITPYKIASYAGANGYYVAGSGSSWSLMTEAALNFGVAGTEIALSESSVTEELNAGHPIICSMKQGDFTTDGHFIVLTGMADGKIQVHDPNSKERSSRTWDYATLEPQIENLWSFTKL